jgi:predicted TIM-barrel fold metal-dependent hydrolase
MESENLPIWIDAPNVDPAELHAVVKSHPKANFLLAEVHYAHLPWAIPLLKSLPNTYIELSRFVSVDGVNRLLNLIGGKRILFGSRFPESSMAPQVYSLHLNDLSNEDLTAICAGNLERLLGLT